MNEQSESQTGWLPDPFCSLPVLAWSTDPAGRIRCIQDQSFHQQKNWHSPAPGTLMITWLGAADSKGEVFQAHRLALSGITTSFRMVCAGELFHGWVTPKLSDGGDVEGCCALAVGCGAVEDSTEDSDRTTYAVSRETLDLPWQQIVEETLDFAVIVDETAVVQQVTRANSEFAHVHFFQRSLLDVVCAEDREELQDALAGVLRTGISERVEFGIPKDDEEPRWYAARLIRLRETEERCSVLVFGTDITRRKEREQKLTREEATLRQLLQVNDRERRLIAYEIHDGFVQDVIGAQMMLAAADDGFVDRPDQVRPYLKEAQTSLAKALDEGRRLINDLRPMVIDEMGLVDAIGYMIQEEIARGQLQVTLDSRVRFGRLEPLVEGTIYRILQEAMNNARRHAEATRLDIRLTQIGDSYFVLEIQDDGCGFEPSQVPEQRYGLEGMRERARAFGGGFTIESAPGTGTRITVKLPLTLPD